MVATSRVVQADRRRHSGDESIVYYLELAGEDDRLAIAEAGLACEDLKPIAPGIASAQSIDVRAAQRLAQTHTIVEHVATANGDLDTLVAALEGESLDGEGSIAVRATAVRGVTGIDTPTVESTIGSVLVEQGFSVDLDNPDRIFRVLATDQSDITWYGGWVVVSPERSYGHRRPPKRPFRQPGTMRPQLARTLINLSRVQPGETLLDPMCGAGAFLIEGALIGATPVGIDLQSHMVEGARENVQAFTESDDACFIRGSAAALPIRSADVAVFDAPYGRQSPIGFESAPALIEHTLSELIDVVERTVVVFDRPIDESIVPPGWTITQSFQRRVHRSLTRYIVVLHRNR